MIKVGVIGTGLIGPVHIGALKRMPGVEVSVLAERDQSFAEEKANLLGIPRSVGSYEEVLADPDIDVVHICVPNHLHYDVTVNALKAGKHVVCEKPLAISSQQSHELVHLAREKKRVAAVHFNLRYYPLIRNLKQLVSEGDIGEVFAIHGSYLQDWLFYEHDYNWRLSPEVSGESRAVADIGSHWIDMMLHLTGLTVEKVFADLTTFHRKRKKPKHEVSTYGNMLENETDTEDVEISTEDFGTIIFHLNDNKRAVLTVSQMSAGRKNQLTFEINGTNKSAAWDSQLPNQMWFGYRDKANEILLKDPSIACADGREMMTLPGGHNEGFHDASLQLFTEVYKDVRQGEPSDNPLYPSFADGHKELQILDAILMSHRTEKWVTL